MNKKLSRFGLLILCGLVSSQARADFFKMPDLTEVPQLERKSLLKDLDIPGVRDRDPDPESGPRLNITRFKLEGIVEYPELGITRAEIDTLIEGIRFDLMQEYKIQESGFTEKEIEEVSKLLVEIEEETQDRHVTDLEVQKLIWLVRDQRSRRGVTLGQIETVADRITNFYRERGFILAKAYIPQQQVRDGIVTLTLLLGALGEVDVVGGELYRKPRLTAVFDDSLAEPVTDAVIEEKLYLVNDFPGIVATGYFEPGSQVGDTKLNLNIVDESRVQGSLRIDNHGSEQTGENRLYADLKLNNLLGYADQLEFAGLYAFDPSNTDYYQVRYSSYLFNPRLRIGLGASTNDFVLGPGNVEAIDNLDLSGKTRQSDITASYSIKRSRTNSLYGIVKYESVQSELRVGVFSGGGDVGLDDSVKNLSFSFGFDLLDEQDKILHQGDVSLLLGRFTEGEEVGQDERYSILSMNYSLLTFWKLPLIDATTRVIYRSSFQYTDSALSSINQYALAGPTRVRAYAPNQFSADSGIFAGVDWVFNAPGFLDFSIGGVNMKETMRPFLFLDASWGQVKSLADDQEEDSGELLGAGFGLQFFYKEKFQGNLQLAFPLEERFSSDDIIVEDEKSRLVFDFQYSFN